MNPNNGSQGGDSPNPPAPQDTQSAAANVLRSQIDSLYNGEPVATSGHPQQQPAHQQATYHSAATTDQGGENPYERTHSDHPQPQADQWKAYHSAWQTYYQKYYEAYYTHETAKHAA